MKFRPIKGKGYDLGIAALEYYNSQWKISIL